jgi:23S rRNA (uracil1939-C5)-methyltransferase
MGRKKNITFENVTVEDVANEGKSIARINNMVVFMQGAVPGDVVDLRVTNKKKSFMEAVVTKIHSYSSDRAEPFCSHFGLCGGCKWQHLPYESQLQYKHKLVKENLIRIGKVEMPEIRPIMGASPNTYYRNKLEFTFTDKRWLTKEELAQADVYDRRGVGFHIPGFFDKVVDVEHCYLQAEPSNRIRLGLKAFAKAQNIAFYDHELKEGMLRELFIRTANTGDVMVALTFFKNHQETIKRVMDFLKQEFPEITSLHYIINSKINTSIADLEAIHYAGEPFMTEAMEDLRFRVGPKSFYQTNSSQAYQLYKVTREFAGLTGNEVVYDLYTGTGTIAQFVAKQAKEVIGIEYVEEAVADARDNAKLNNIGNARFYAGDMKDLLNEDFLSTHPRPDVIITDPPRAGMHPDVVEMLLRIGAPRIVYVSCNVATQARDISMLGEMYAVKAIQPVDMFPHTHHVENVALLERK